MLPPLAHIDGSSLSEGIARIDDKGTDVIEGRGISTGKTATSGQDPVKLIPELIGQHPVDQGVHGRIGVTNPVGDKADGDPHVPGTDGDKVLEHCQDVDGGVTGQIDDGQGDEKPGRDPTAFQAVEALSGEAAAAATAGLG